MFKSLKRIIIIILLFLVTNAFFLNYVQANNDVVLEDDISNKRFSDIYNNYLLLSDEEKSEYNVIPSIYDVSIDEYNSKNYINSLNIAQNIASNNLPSSFDLRSKINIRVENQRPHGTCWAFASMGALRTHLALRGYKDNEGKTLDFSELHLDYLTSNLYSQKGYGRNVHTGGSFKHIEKYLRYNDGPIYESELPYNTVIDENETQLNRLDNMQPAFYVHDIIKFPSIYKYNENGVVKYYNNNIEVTEQQVKDIRNQIKTHIVVNGGLYCSIRTNNVFIGDNLGAPYNTYPGRYSQYDDGSIRNKDCGSHGVTIVGWNDNYDRMNFYAKNKDGEIVHPNSNGAYLVLNSYGEDNFDSGYQWISYEDHAIESSINGFVNVDQTPVTVKYTFKNGNAYSALKNTFNTEGAYMITDDSNLTIEVYDITINSIENLNLDSCNLNDEDIAEIFKYEFPNLKLLNLNYNKLTTISPILKNTNLINLNINSNAQEQLDIKGISALKNLQYINLNNNKSLKNYSEIFNLSKIETLLLYNDGIIDITGIKNLTNLERVTLSKNKIVDISEIQYLNKLKRLELSENNIEDISKLNISQYTENFTIDNQKITKLISNSINNYDYPDIFRKAKNQNSGVYSDDGFEFTNCSENTQKNGIIFNNTGNEIKVRVKSGLLNNSTLNLIPLGDVDRNNIIDLRDVIAILRHISSQEGTKYYLTEEKQFIADVNQDEKVDLKDVIGLLRDISKTN